MRNELKNISAEQTILIAGPTASGKSALAMELAAWGGGVIVNADALQVFANWRILTARPSEQDEAQLLHALYGHVPGDQAYSVGQWLRDVREVQKTGERLIIVGGTGLYFSALTEGLADIPVIPREIRTKGDQLLLEQGLDAMVGTIDGATLARIDAKNPMRVQRAWEVLNATGRGLASWQDDTPPPLLPVSNARALLLNAERDWLNARIELRFQQMLDQGALDEARQNHAGWSRHLPSAKAIGASDLIAHLDGNVTLRQASDSANIATRQFAKRQRSWFRSRMSRWTSMAYPG